MPKILDLCGINPSKRLKIRWTAFYSSFQILKRGYTMLFQNTSLGAKFVIGALLALALFVGGFVTAQATQKPIVEERIVEKIVEVEKLQLVEKIRVIVVKDTESKKS